MKQFFHLLRGSVVLSAFAFLLIGCKAQQVMSSTGSFQPNRGFVRCEMTVAGKERNVWVFVPNEYSPTKRMPAILFLHGLFEAGDDGNKMLTAGLGPVIAEDPEHWPFITIFPQSDGNWKGEDHDQIAIAALDAAEHRWAIDKDRVILAGLSYGGLGVWEIGSRHIDRFAALVPVSGHCSADSVHELLHTPIWAFSSHGDPWVRSVNSEQMIRTIDSQGGRARWTEFNGDQHDCWASAVFESDLVPWMLRQRRPGSLNSTATASLVFPITASVR